MQDEKQYEQLIMQYNQLKNGAEDISAMLDNEDYDSAITMLKAREPLFASCKNIRRYLEMTPLQQKEADALAEEIRELELKNIKKLEKSMDDVKSELIKAQKNQKIQQAYDSDIDLMGSIVNIQE